MSVVMLLPGTNGSLLLVQRTVTRTIVLQETIGKGQFGKVCQEAVDVIKIDKDFKIGDATSQMDELNALGRESKKIKFCGSRGEEVPTVNVLYFVLLTYFISKQYGLPETQNLVSQCHGLRVTEKTTVSKKSILINQYLIQPLSEKLSPET
ncbi:hypothetical protein STEG23_014308, partial [Scotinomys teguina]